MKIRYTNFKNHFPNCNCNAVYTQWFYIERRWGGKIINIGVKWHQLSFDFRKNWIMDMMTGSH